jgi:hypothetical protein
MLYPKNKDKSLSKELFKNPTAEYRGTPFWAWNCKLDKELLHRQIDQLKEMGMGGFHMHSRVGLDTEYLGPEFMEMVKSCNEKAKQEDMLCWLYDEDKWPSGYAGGYVTKEEKYRARFLVFSSRSFEAMNKEMNDHNSSAKAQRSSNRTLIGKYEVILKDGSLDSYKRLEEGEVPSKGSKLWWAYLEVSGDSPWFNNEAYVNTLDKKAIERFVEVTHEKYYKELGQDFGKSVPAIFTDEPQFSHKQSFKFAEEERDVIIPFTDDFEETYKELYGESIIDHLPELFWELPEGEISLARYRYHDHISERFASAFADTVGNWCKDHNIMLTGHMMSEPTLASQTAALGEAMRSYRSFQLPGIDMLCDSREYTTAKQAQSAANQFGYPGVLSELYGVTNWDFDFRGHKLQGDWQAALGLTVRVHHLTWVSMGGEAKRDYPACIGYQSPWYKEYPLIEDHFSRLNTALTRGKPHVKVGVIHPIESYWLHWGPMEQTAAVRQELDNNFKEVTEGLLFGLIDFNYIAESLFPIQCDVKTEAPIKVGEMSYEVIVVPGCETLRGTTVERLEAFQKAGGKIVFAGEIAKLVDGVKSNRVQRLAENCTVVPLSTVRIVQELEEYRDLDIRRADGARSDSLIYQMRDEADRKWLFICNGKKLDNPDIPIQEKLRIGIKGNWSPVIYDTMTGETKSCDASIYNGKTWIECKFYQHDSLLLCLEPGEPKLQEKLHQNETYISSIYIEDPVAITLSEPNVLLLDMAEYSFDGDAWKDREELLRVDNIFRKALGYPLRMDAMAQPWVNKKVEETRHTLSLRFNIESEIVVAEPYLALENAENTEIILNGVKVNSMVEGWFVDEGIKKVKLPQIPKGTSEIVLNIPFNSKTNVEWCYLLGDFGVKVRGSHAKITAQVRELAFGDWVNQGLPFYAGNVTYHCKAVTEEGELTVEVPQFRNPLTTVALDGKKKEVVAFAPYRVNLGKVEAGEHSIDITAFGNRINAFGALHNCNRSVTWHGPNSWRSVGTSWSYEYQLKPTGILISPTVSLKK